MLIARCAGTFSAFGVATAFFTMVATSTARAEQSRESEALPRGKANLAVMLTAVTPTDKLKLGDEVPPILVSFANLGTKPVYISVMAKPSLTLRDTDGKSVQGAPIEDPPPSPPTHYIVRDGRRILMDPVWRLDPGMGVVKVVSDPLWRYRATLREGTYVASIPLTSLSTYTEDQVVARNDVDHKLWVEVGTAREKQTVLSNSLSITVKSARD